MVYSKIIYDESENKPNNGKLIEHDNYDYGNKKMQNKLDGFVVYCINDRKKIPIGVVSDNYDCKAITNYVPSRLNQYLIEIEDKRFYCHKGIDLKGVARAIFKNINSGKIIQGGSTISQQLARNILRDNKKTISRKIKESIKAIKIESKYTKSEILNLYFNNVYFGKNIWGIRAAGLHYFGKEVDKLSSSNLLYLLAILRGPNYYVKRPEITSIRYNAICNILYKKNIITKNQLHKVLNSNLQFKETRLTNIKNITVPYIINQVDEKRKSIISSLDIKIQSLANDFVSNSKYPVSIIAIRHGKVIGFSSSYGTDFPFVSKSNVGSTLKPFLYCFLRDNGITKDEVFKSYENELAWGVREVSYYKPLLNIQEALFYSNNNTFINAACKVGINATLNFLASTLCKPQSDFYPSSILGATKSGISIYDLALAYSIFFSPDNMTESKKECHRILNSVFQRKLGGQIENAFLKTGTTNDNKERYAVLGNADLTYVVLRNEMAIEDVSKEGNFLNQISKYIANMFKSNINFTWI